MGGRYLNPIYKGPCADPFVLKHRGEYWCYSTGFSEDGRCFPILHSRDLVNWEEINGAMSPLSDGSSEYWAPEVIYDNGRFLMYYSAGDGVRMDIRVAIAKNPGGPFRDSGHRLTPQEFAIDAHVFQDDDGSRYLFYATDFLIHSHVGTGTVCDRMLDAFALAGDPRPVSLACYDWHVFDPERIEKGGVRWHTLEGPFVLKHKGLYYQMFSAGNWKNITYGVSYAITDSIAEGEWRQVADGERVLPILRTIPGKVFGPGHNSVIRGPDNQQLFCVYHRWSKDRSDRVLAIDRLEWAGDRLIVLGASTTEQPIPILPTKADDFSHDRATDLGDGWNCVRGQWSVLAGEARQQSDDSSAEAFLEIGAPYFVLEVSIRALATEPGVGAAGVELWDGEGVALSFVICSSPRRALIAWRSNGGWVERELPLPNSFVPDVFHLVSVKCNDSVFTVSLDGGAATFADRIAGLPLAAALVTRECPAAFSGFAVTIGWEDDFYDTLMSPSDLGWNGDHSGDWEVSNGELRPVTMSKTSTSIFKGPLLESYELVFNARQEVRGDDAGGYGVFPASIPGEPGPLLIVMPGASGWCVSCNEASGAARLPLPTEFDPCISQQFRIRKSDGHATIWWESVLLGSLKVSHLPTRIGLYARNALVGFDLVRVTAMSNSA